MTVRECYEIMGADYEEILARLRTEERIERFVLKFPKDPSYQNLTKALLEKNREEAFMAAHSIKGVSQNLGLTRLYESSQELTESLRPGSEEPTEEALEAMLHKVEEDYKQTISAIERLAEESGNTQ